VVLPNSIGAGAFVSSTTRDTIAPPAIWLPADLEATAGFVTRLALNEGQKIGCSCEKMNRKSPVFDCAVALCTMQNELLVISNLT
jgi:hypothetical protein